MRKLVPPVLLLAAGLLLAGCGTAPAARSSAYARLSAEQSSDIAIHALGLVGTPYRFGGNTPEGGFDCSGLIGYVYRDAAGIRLPRSTREMSAMRWPQVPRNALQPGDLLFFATSGGGQVSHAGIYVGEGRFVHAPSSGGTVRLDSLTTAYWSSTFLNAKRILAGDALVGRP